MRESKRTSANARPSPSHTPACFPEPHPGLPWKTFRGLWPPDPTSVAGPAHAKSRESRHSSHTRTQLYIPAGRLLSPSLSTSSFPAASSAAIEITRFSGSGCREASTWRVHRMIRTSTPHKAVQSQHGMHRTRPVACVAKPCTLTTLPATSVREATGATEMRVCSGSSRQV